MKTNQFAILSGALLITVHLATLARLDAQSAAAESAPASSDSLTGVKSAVQADFETLPVQQQEVFRNHLKQASSLISRDRLLESFGEIEKAEKIFPNYPTIFNLRGAAWVRLKEIDKARASFRKALAINPDAFDVKFNLAELDFVEHKFAPALKAFTAITKEYPKLPTAQYDLVQYKKHICHLRLGQEKKADAIQKAFSYTDDSPAYYYTRIAKAYAANDSDEAASWLQSAANIFAPEQNQIYLDALIEMGWVRALDKPTKEKN